MFDSAVIVEYLELVKTEPRMIPIDLWERVIVRKWEAIADGICDVTVNAVLEQRRPADKQDPTIIDRADKKILATLRFLDGELQGRNYVFNNEFSLADAALLTALGYVTLRRPQLLESFAGVNAYGHIHRTRPSIIATVPPG